MAKKPISQKRAERQQQENQVLQRVFNAFLLGMAAECYLFIVYRNYVTGTVPQMLTWVQILRWGGWRALGCWRWGRYWQCWPTGRARPSAAPPCAGWPGRASSWRPAAGS